MTKYPNFHCQCPAKINLGLKIGAPTTNGYHQVTTVMAKIPLTDELEVCWRPQGATTSLICDHPTVPTDERNLILQIMTKLQQRFDLPPAVITLHKQIPVAAGLAGGSSNAGTLLAELNQHCHLGLSNQDLATLALDIGADVPFFTHTNSCALEQHHGLSTLITTVLPKLPKCQLVLIYQDFPLDTTSMYHAFDQWAQAPGATAQHVTTTLNSLVTACQSQNLAAIATHLSNDFFPIIQQKYPEIAALPAKLLAAGALGAGLTGKGPTIFGLWPPNVPIQLDFVTHYQVLAIES